MAAEFLSITPIIKVYSAFSEVREFFDKMGGVSYFETDQPLTIADLAHGNRNLIIGEPGVGKTLLLEKLKEHLDSQQTSTCLISLRQTNVLTLIDDFVRSSTGGPKTLLM